jgi:hypothetical protein
MSKEEQLKILEGISGHGKANVMDGRQAQQSSASISPSSTRKRPRDDEEEGGEARMSPQSPPKAKRRSTLLFEKSPNVPYGIFIHYNMKKGGERKTLMDLVTKVCPFIVNRMCPSMLTCRRLLSRPARRPIL